MLTLTREDQEIGQKHSNHPGSKMLSSNFSLCYDVTNQLLKTLLGMSYSWHLEKFVMSTRLLNGDIQRQDVQDYHYQHEEADTRIIFHMNKILEQDPTQRAMALISECSFYIIVADSPRLLKCGWMLDLVAKPRDAILATATNARHGFRNCGCLTRNTCPNRI